QVVVASPAANRAHANLLSLAVIVDLNLRFEDRSRVILKAANNRCVDQPIAFAATDGLKRLGDLQKRLHALLAARGSSQVVLKKAQRGAVLVFAFSARNSRTEHELNDPVR